MRFRTTTHYATSVDSWLRVLEKLFFNKKTSVVEETGREANGVNKKKETNIQTPGTAQNILTLTLPAIDQNQVMFRDKI